jgi:hypothetical protein
MERCLEVTGETDGPQARHLPGESVSPEPIAEPFTTATLIATIRRALCSVSGARKGGNNLRYAMRDAGLSAFLVFFMQSPSFLDFQIRMRKERGRNNAGSLFGAENSSKTHQFEAAPVVQLA